MPTSDDSDFAAVAEALYATPASGFVAARNARAKEARAAGQRDLAARITALPKPSAAAALVNLLVHAGDDGLDPVLALGAELRSAQEDADRDRLRELGSRRRDLLTEVTRSAARLAEQSGSKPGPAVLEELQQTLQAAVVDDGAAAAIRTGRLVRSLAADGLDPVDLTDAIGGPGATTPGPTGKRPLPSPSAGQEGQEDGEQEESRRRETAERRAAEAADHAEDARRLAEEAAGRASDAEDELRNRKAAADDLQAKLDDLQEALAAAHDDLTAAEQSAEEARTARDAALRAADEADRAAADLAAAIER